LSQEIESKQSQSKSKEMSIQTQTSQNRPVRRCGICGVPGHIRTHCEYEVKLVLKTSVATSDPPEVVKSVTTPDPPEPVEPDTCPICMENLGKTNFCVTACKPIGHKFCLECMLKHTKTKTNCPLCRANIPGATQLARQGGQQTNPIPFPRGTFKIRIDNMSTQDYDVWRLPREPGDPPWLMYSHEVITSRSIRFNVGAIGDRFLLTPGGVRPFIANAHLNRFSPITYNSAPGTIEYYVLADEAQLVQIN